LSVYRIRKFADVPLSDSLSPAPNTLIGVSVVLLLAAATFGHFNGTKVETLRSTIVDANAARELTERSRVRHEKAVRARESAESHLAQVLIEKTQLEAKLHDKESEPLALQKRMEENQPASLNPGAPSAVELQAQLDDARQQLEIAEREKSLLSEKVQAITSPSAQLEEEKKAPGSGSSKSRRPRQNPGRQSGL